MRYDEGVAEGVRVSSSRPISISAQAASVASRSALGWLPSPAKTNNKIMSKMNAKNDSKNYCKLNCYQINEVQKSIIVAYLHSGGAQDDGE